MILYHGTPISNWEAIQREGLSPGPLPPGVAASSGKKEGIYLGVSALVDGFIEGYLLDESGEVKFVKLVVDVLNTDKLIIDPAMEDPDQPGIHFAYIYSERISFDVVSLVGTYEYNEDTGEGIWS